jgi:hypothetical protein
MDTLKSGNAHCRAVWGLANGARYAADPARAAADLLKAERDGKLRLSLSEGAKSKAAVGWIANPNAHKCEFSAFAVYDLLGETEKAWLALQRAHGLARGERANYSHQIEWLKNMESPFPMTPTEKQLARPLPWYAAVPQLVFIVGMPRSGSSLLERLLLSRPGTATLGELSPMDRHAISINGEIANAAVKGETYAGRQKSCLCNSFLATLWPTLSLIFMFRCSKCLPTFDTSNSQTCQALSQTWPTFGRRSTRYIPTEFVRRS